MPLEPFNKSQFIDIWRRSMDAEYTCAIEELGDGQGLDLPSAQAAIFEKVDEAMNVCTQAYFLKPSSNATGPIAAGGARGTTTLQISRIAPTVGDLQLVTGTRLVAFALDTTGNDIFLAEYELAGDVIMPEGTLGPIDAPVVAIFPGYQGNVLAGSITAFVIRGRASVPATVISTTQLNSVKPNNDLFDEFTGAMPGQFVRLLSLPSGNTFPRLITSFSRPPTFGSVSIDPPIDAADIGATITAEVQEYEDVGLTVAQPDDVVGGVDAFLDGIGRDRRAGRVEDEDDEQYRTRLCNLADNISPAAIERIVSGILDPLGICFCIKETTAPGLHGLVYDDYDAPIPPNGPNAYDIDDAGLCTDGIVYLSLSDAHRFFVICVCRSSLGEFGAAFDEGGAIPNAFDEMFFDGEPVTFNSALAQISERVNAARAAGVHFTIELKDPPP